MREVIRANNGLSDQNWHENVWQNRPYHCREREKERQNFSLTNMCWNTNHFIELPMISS